jgi:hypothetical protein
MGMSKIVSVSALVAMLFCAFTVAPAYNCTYAVQKETNPANAQKPTTLDSKKLAELPIAQNSEARNVSTNDLDQTS